jgi:hypothetical protein
MLTHAFLTCDNCKLAPELVTEIARREQQLTEKQTVAHLICSECLRHVWPPSNQQGPCKGCLS